MFFQIWLTMQMIGIVFLPFVVAWARDIKDKYLIDFLNASKTFSEAKEYDEFSCVPNHPAGCFDETALENWFYEKYNIDLWDKEYRNYYNELFKLLKIYQILGIVKRKCYHNHYVYRVR